MRSKGLRLHALPLLLFALAVLAAFALLSRAQTQPTAQAQVTLYPAPTNLTVTRSAGALNVSWNASHNAIKYHINFSNDNRQNWKSASDNHTTTSITITGADDSATYYVAVRAGWNIGGSDRWSDWTESDAIGPYVPPPTATPTSTPTPPPTATPTPTPTPTATPVPGPPPAFSKSIAVNVFYTSATVDETLPAASGGTGNVTYSMSGLPSWATFTAGTRRLTGTAPSSAASVVRATLTATDSATTPKTATMKISITVIADTCSSDTSWYPSTPSAALIKDCNILLAAKSTLSGTSTSLNWSTATNMQTWTGITAPLNPGRVTQLSVWSKSLDGTIPPMLGALSRMELLYLYKNSLTGAIPPEFGALSSLEWLRLDENSLSGSIPAELGDMSALRYMYMQKNGFSGSIPPELGNLSNLFRLNLDYNSSLTSTIPKELGKLTKLNEFRAIDTPLTGGIPKELGSMAALTRLYLYNTANYSHTNKLTGSIPTELGNLSNLQYMSLSRNSLSGSIPTELGGLSKLKRLFLDRNSLSGSIPTEFGNL